MNKISNYINVETIRLSLHTGLGYLCGSLIGLVTHSTHPNLWKVVGTIAPIAHFALEKIIERQKTIRGWQNHEVRLWKDILKTAELGIATIVLAAVKFNGPVLTAFFLGLTILSGYEARQKYIETKSPRFAEEDGQELTNLQPVESDDEL